MGHFCRKRDSIFIEIGIISSQIYSDISAF